MQFGHFRHSGRVAVVGINFASAKQDQKLLEAVYLLMQRKLQHYYAFIIMTADHHPQEEVEHLKIFFQKAYEKAIKKQSKHSFTPRTIRRYPIFDQVDIYALAHNGTYNTIYLNTMEAHHEVRKTMNQSIRSLFVSTGLNSFLKPPTIPALKTTFAINIGCEDGKRQNYVHDKSKFKTMQTTDPKLAKRWRYFKDKPKLLQPPHVMIDDTKKTIGFYFGGYFLITKFIANMIKPWSWKRSIDKTLVRVNKREEFIMRHGKTMRLAIFNSKTLGSLTRAWLQRINRKAKLRIDENYFHDFSRGNWQCTPAAHCKTATFFNPYKH